MPPISAAQLQRVRGFGTDAFPSQRIGGGAGEGGASFGDTLKSAIDKVDASQKTADAHIEAFVAGESEDLHQVMISMNEAKVQFQLMTEVRNKTLETYQELMRMQV